MTMKTLRVEANERVDFNDFKFLVADSLDALLRRPGEALYAADPAARSWVLEGFALANPTGKQLQVGGGRAILAARIDGSVNYGYLLDGGAGSQTIDLGPMTPGTYGVYIRFEILDSDPSSRVFWDPAGTGTEFASTVPTRRSASWSVRVETTNPGPEWAQIGTADNSGVGLVIVDLRPLFFEGVPATTYPSGWSAEGGGVADDRNPDRSLYGVTDLQSFSAAVRQCVEDIKGRGLRRWWDEGLGGMNLGFDTDPVESRLALDDDRFFLQGDPATPYWQFDDDDKIEFDRGQNFLNFILGTENEMRLRGEGLSVRNGLYVGSVTNTPTDNEIYAEGDVKSGAYLRASGRIYIGTDDWMQWDGGNWDWWLNNVAEMRLSDYGLEVSGPAVSVYDSDFRMDFQNVDKPRHYFDLNTYMEYDRSAPGTVGYRAVQDGDIIAGWRDDTDTGPSVFSGNGVFWSDLHTPTGNALVRTINANTSPMLLARVNADGTIRPETHWNCVGTVHTLGTGAYQVYLSKFPAGSTGYYPMIVTPNANADRRAVAARFSAAIVTVVTRDGAGTSIDSDFSLIVYSAEN